MKKVMLRYLMFTSHQREPVENLFVSCPTFADWKLKQLSPSSTIWQVKKRKVKGDTRPLQNRYCFTPSKECMKPSKSQEIPANWSRILVMFCVLLSAMFGRRPR